MYNDRGKHIALTRTLNERSGRRNINQYRGSSPLQKGLFRQKKKKQFSLTYNNSLSNMTSWLATWAGVHNKEYLFLWQLICISSVCLALTLVVYLSLPELRNLHGRTLICHVSMMLLAFSCLARVQYSRVPNNTACTVLGKLFFNIVFLSFFF